MSEDPWLPSLHVLNCEYIKMLNPDLLPLECEVKCLALSKQKALRLMFVWQEHTLNAQIG